MAIQYGFDMYNDKERGCSTRELEQKYKCSRVSIYKYWDAARVQLWNHPESPYNKPKFKDEVKKFLDSMIIIKVSNSDVSEADNAD